MFATAHRPSASCPRRTVATLCLLASSAAAIAAPGDLLVQLSVSSSNLLRVNVATGAQSIVPIQTADATRSPWFITQAPDGTTYRFLNSSQAPTTSRIERVDLATGAASIVANNVNAWNLGGAGFCVEPAGTILFTGYGGRSVQRINPATGQVSEVITGATGHAFYGGLTDAAGRIYLLDSFNNVGTLKRFDPLTFASTTIAASLGLNQADDMAFSADGSALFVGNRSFNGLRRVNLSNNALSTIAGTLRGPLGLATGPGNTIYAGVAGSLVSVDTLSGAVTTITSGNLFNARAYGIVLEVPAPGGAACLLVSGLLAARRRRA